MLRKEAVSTHLLECLDGLMEMRTLRTHRLVGGTALALQIGHRLSIDIDLFSDQTNKYDDIQDELHEKFGNSFAKGRNVNGLIGKGISVFLNDIKTDIIDCKSAFIRPPLIYSLIRIATKEDIIPMKFNTFLCLPEFARYEKKDFIDIGQLMKEYRLEQMIDLYSEKYPNELMSSRLIIEGLLLSELADKKVMPKMLIADSWKDTKMQIQKSIDLFLSDRGI